MHAQYDDIVSRISSPPLWFDENAVPRYCEFAPSRSASIYVNEIALAEITCQGCRRLFRVAFSKLNVDAKTVAEAIRTKKLHYGDPPNVRCCASVSSNSEPRRVLEYWKRHDEAYVGKDGIVTNKKLYMEWRRNSSFEVDIRPEWVVKLN